MKRIIVASRVNEFMKYYEDPNNYSRNEDNFDKMYDILSQYGDEDEDVDVVFKRANPEDQQKMIDLIKPGVKFGERGYAQNMYYKALEVDIENADPEYCKGVVDAIEALFAEGWVDEQEFRTDL